MSGYSHYSDVSIDPIIRSKAEKILENQKDRINLSQLEVIQEESRLTSTALKHLPGDNRIEIDQKSVMSKLKSTRTDVKSKG